MVKGDSKGDVVLVGYSGHALVVAEALLLSGYTLHGFLEKERVSVNLLNLEYLGFEQDKTVLEKIGGKFIFPCLGNNLLREEVFNLFSINRFKIITVSHPNSNVSDSVVIGSGTFVARGANINPFVNIGKGVIINTGSIIEHECLIEDFVHIAPGAVLAGNVTVGHGSFIGANAVVKQGVTIGRNAIIGAGSVVLADIEGESMYVGNPAKRLER